jgi:ATP-binding cassette subfamily B protein
MRHDKDKVRSRRRASMRMWKSLLMYAGEFKGRLIILVFVMLIVAGIDLIFPLMTKIAVDRFVEPGSVDGLGLFAAAFFAMSAIQAANVYLLIHLGGVIEMGLVYRLRERGFEKLQRLSFEYFDKKASGWLLTRMTSDCQRLGEVISWGIVDMVWGLTFMTGVAITMLVLNFRLGIVILSVVPLLSVASYYFQTKILKSQRLVRKNNSRISAGYSEGIQGGPTVKVLAREKESAEEFNALTTRMRKTSIISARFSALYLPVVLFLGSVGTALALSYGGVMIQNEVITFGTLLAFISYTMQFFDPLNEIARVVSEMQSARAAGERILSMIHTQEKITDAAIVENLYGTVIEPKKDNWPDIRGEIEFDNVGFTYDGGQTVLEHFRLKIPAGQTVALVGATGSGKTTIVNLVCRFYEPTSGRILIDGQDYRDIGLPALRGNLGYVLQAPQLFNISIRENIRYGNLDASDEQVEVAAKLANAHGFIMDIEKGYDAVVGEGGNHLSTGQKQLISLARAILADPAIIVLDEATSSVDPETEKLIQDAIHTVLNGRTSFVIAHRLSTIREADRILVIEKGVIIEDGDHDSLIRANCHYAAMYRRQFMEEEEFRVLSSGA